MLDLQSTALPLISADRLGTMLGAPGVVIIDASWYLPAVGRDPEAEYASAHIPGAIRLSLDVLSDPTSSLPHMLPPAGRFAADMTVLGLLGDVGGTVGRALKKMLGF